MSWRARLSTNIQEILLVYCPESQASEGARNFIVNNYPELKRLNPRLPILIRPAENQRARLFARYDYNGQAIREIDNLTERDIVEKLQELNLIGTQAIKATAFEWQESVPKDVASLSYEEIKRKAL